MREQQMQKPPAAIQCKIECKMNQKWASLLPVIFAPVVRAHTKRYSLSGFCMMFLHTMVCFPYHDSLVSSLGVLGTEHRSLWCELTVRSVKLMFTNRTESNEGRKLLCGQLDSPTPSFTKISHRNVILEPKNDVSKTCRKYGGFFLSTSCTYYYICSVDRKR